LDIERRQSSHDQNSFVTYVRNPVTGREAKWACDCVNETLIPLRRPEDLLHFFNGFETIWIGAFQPTQTQNETNNAVSTTGSQSGSQYNTSSQSGTYVEESQSFNSTNNHETLSGSFIASNGFDSLCLALTSPTFGFFPCNDSQYRYRAVCTRPNNQ